MSWNLLSLYHLRALTARQRSAKRAEAHRRPRGAPGPTHSLRFEVQCLGVPDVITGYPAEDALATQLHSTKGDCEGELGRLGRAVRPEG